MSTAVAKRESAKIGRPLKILIPLIKEDIEHGDRAGMEYYADAGDKLLEAKPLVARGYWTSWMSKNFALSERTAQQYMRLSKYRAEQKRSGAAVLPSSLREMDGSKDRTQQQRKREKPYREAIEDLETDFYTQEKQTREDEVRLHRELALELVDIGYKALASRLHPDRGGSKDAMSRLNCVREELKGIAKTRRFV